MAEKNVEMDDLFVEDLKPGATPISTVVATECCGICNSSCAAQDFEAAAETVDASVDPTDARDKKEPQAPASEDAQEQKSQAN